MNIKGDYLNAVELSELTGWLAMCNWLDVREWKYATNKIGKQMVLRRYRERPEEQ